MYSKVAIQWSQQREEAATPIASLDFPERLASDWSDSRALRAEKMVDRKIIAGPNALHPQFGNLTKWPPLRL